MHCPSTPPPTDHETLRLGLMSAGLQVQAALENPEAFAAAREGLVQFCLTDLLPHLAADDQWLLEAQRCPEGGLLAQAMRAEARAMTAAAHELVTTTTACEAIAVTRVLHSLLAAHSHHEKLLLAAEHPAAP